MKQLYKQNKMTINKTLEEITDSLCTTYCKDNKSNVVDKSDLYTDLHYLVKLCKKQNPNFDW